MAIKQCSECGGKVSNRLDSCPHCGAPIEPGLVYVEPQQSQISQQVSPVAGGAILEPVETFHDNGQLREKGTRKDGVLDGPYERHYENGGVMQKGTYKDGKKCGEWLIFGNPKIYPPCSSIPTKPDSGQPKTSLVSCQHCGHGVAQGVMKCPNCGGVPRNIDPGDFLLRFVVIVLVIYFVIWLLMAGQCNALMGSLNLLLQCN